MVKYLVTPLSVSVHPKEESPLFGESATIVSIEDEGGGPFIQIYQSYDGAQEGICRFDDYNELLTVTNAAKELIEAHEALLNDKT